MGGAAGRGGRVVARTRYARAAVEAVGARRAEAVLGAVAAVVAVAVEGVVARVDARARAGRPG